MLTQTAHRFILGSRIDVTSYDDVCDRVQAWVAANTSCYIIAANVHVVMTGYWNRSFQHVINHAALVTPDGMPLVWGLRWLGVPRQSRVYGPDLMLGLCQRAAREQIPIYLYGGAPAVLERLRSNLEEWFPGLAIVGTHAPPFRSLTPAEDAADIEQIRASGAAIVFVGLGCPKQERWMAQHHERLPAVMVGVGAAFDFHSGRVSQAPRWMMARGLEWLYRLIKEPQRLWRRYLIYNPAFICLFGWQLFQHWLRRVRNLNP